MTTVMSTVMAILMDPVMDYGNEVMRRIGCFTFCLYIVNRMAVSPQLELEIVFGYKLFVLSWQASTICQYSSTLLYMVWQMPFLTSCRSVPRSCTGDHFWGIAGGLPGVVQEIVSKVLPVVSLEFYWRLFLTSYR